MRVLFVNEKCGYHGGVEQNVREVAAGLAHRGHEVMLLHTESTPRDGANYRRPFELVVQQPGALPPPLLREMAPDVIYVHRYPRIRVLQDAAGDIPVVRMIHDHDVYCPRRHKYYAIGGGICHRAAGWACWLDGAFLERQGTRLGYVSVGAKLSELEDNRRLGRVVVASRYMRDQLVVNGFDRARVEVIPPAVREEGSPAEVAPPGRGRILYVGQLIRGKGVDLLLEAVTGLEDPWELVLVGEGNARPSLEAQVERRGLQGRVHFLGWVPASSLGSVYRAADVVAVPSRWPEPFGMVGLEAMQAGRPVVAFDVGGIPDWLQHEQTGMLVPAGDVGALRRALARLLDEPERGMVMGRSARHIVRERFSFDGMIDALERVLGAPVPEALRLHRGPVAHADAMDGGTR